jgi:hypothetical protein
MLLRHYSFITPLLAVLLAVEYTDDLLKWIVRKIQNSARLIKAHRESKAVKDFDSKPGNSVQDNYRAG